MSDDSMAVAPSCQTPALADTMWHTSPEGVHTAGVHTYWAGSTSPTTVTYKPIRLRFTSIAIDADESKA